MNSSKQWAGRQQRQLNGRLVSLIPYTPDSAGELIKLRNQEEVIYNLVQGGPLTLDGQRNWLISYMDRVNDWGYLVYDPKGACVGSICIYDMDERTGRGEIGRLVFDLSRSLEAPYALEAELLLMDEALDNLNVHTIYATVKEDNEKVIAYNKRLGFVLSGGEVIKGAPHVCLEYSPSDETGFPHRRLYKVVETFSKKLQR